MADLNPYRKGARIFAFLSYLLAAAVILAGVFFTLGAATADLSTLPTLAGATNVGLAMTTACMFLGVAGLVIAVGWQIQSLLGSQFLADKLIARSSVGLLKTGSLGCGFWTLISACLTLTTGRLLSTGEAAGFGIVLIGASGPFLLICVTLAVAWFISANFTELSPAERQLAFQTYLDDVMPRLNKMGEPEAQAFVEGRTHEVLAKLDAPLKRTLLDFLGEYELLSGPGRVRLGKADLRRVDLRSIRLPRADLAEVDLTDANLADSYLYEADLQGARLKGVDLTRANLQDANLRRAILTDALLDKAVLYNADLTGAVVPPQQLDRARLKKTIMPDGRAKG